MSHSAFSNAASTSGSSSRPTGPQITSPHLAPRAASSSTCRTRTASNDSQSSVDSLDTAYEEALSFFQSVANDALMAESSPMRAQGSQHSWASSAVKSPASSSSHARKSSASSNWTVSSAGTALTEYDAHEGDVAWGKAGSRLSFASEDIKWGSPELLRRVDTNSRPAAFSHAATPPRPSATTPTAATFCFPPPPVPASSLPAPPTHHRLTSSTSNATIRAQSGRDRARKASFTSTPVADLDLDAILDAYAASWDAEQRARANTSTDSLGTLATSSAMPDTAFPTPPHRLRSAPSTKSLVARSPVTPSKMSPSAGMAYPNVFPSAKRANSGPFPTRQKSTTSLRDQGSPRTALNSVGFPFPPPPIPAAFRDRASVHGSPKPSMSPRGSVASVMSRSSYASSHRGDSFRWSVNTASTAPTMADDDWTSKRGSRAGSSVRSSVASSAFAPSTPPSFRHKAGSVRATERDEVKGNLVDEEDCDWLTFARELDVTPPPSTFSSRRPSLAPTEEGTEADSESRALSRKEMKALRKSASSKSALSLHNRPSTTSLSRKMSGVSLRHLGKSTSSVARPPIPHRSASLKASLAEEAVRREAIRMA